MTKVFTKKEEALYLVQNWDLYTITELAEDMTKLFKREITREKVMNICFQLRKRGVVLAHKKKESIYDAIKGMKIPKANVYDEVVKEVKNLEIKHI